MQIAKIHLDLVEEPPGALALRRQQAAAVLESACGASGDGADDVQVGDRLVTSGLDGIFPKGLSVGRVTRLSRKDRGLFLYAEVTPTADSSRLEEVLVTAANGAELLDPTPAPLPDLVGPPDPAALGIFGPPAPPADAAWRERAR